jgi:hypothetical protein
VIPCSHVCTMASISSPLNISRKSVSVIWKRSNTLVTRLTFVSVVILSTRSTQQLTSQLWYNMLQLQSKNFGNFQFTPWFSRPWHHVAMDPLNCFLHLQDERHFYSNTYIYWRINVQSLM